VYRRTLDGKVREFGHEGILYRRSFLMYDKGTHSLWVHATGQAVQGPLKGKRLDFVPCVITTWGEWKDLYPRTTVLEGKRASRFMGTFRFRGQESRYGLSVGQGDAPKLYPFALLMKRRLVRDTYEGKPLLVFYDGDARVAVAFRPGDRRFELGPKGPVDADGRAWDLRQGRAKDGSDRMPPVVATAWLIDRWQGFYPDGDVYGSG